MAPRELPAPPRVWLEVLRDRSADTRGDQGFLRMRRLTLRNRYPDGGASAPYDYDVVERAATDAVALVLEPDTPEGGICLRSSLRPPMAFRSEYTLPLADRQPLSVLWEVPAGLVEADERGEAGLQACAARETREEVGLALEPDEFVRLGAAAALSPGVLGEVVYFLHARVDPTRRQAPTEDGSPVEERAEVRFVPLSEALDAAREGTVADMKTEVAIRRLAELRGVR